MTATITEVGIPTVERPLPAPPPPSRQLTSVAAGVGWALVGAGGFLALWGVAGSRTAALPSPAASFDALQVMLRHALDPQAPYGRGIGLQLQSSLGRVFQGFGLAVLLGVPLGLAMGASRRTWKAVNPIVQLLRPVSPLAWFPIWLAITQDGPRASMWVIFVTALWLVVINTAAAAAAVPHEQLDVSRVFRFGRWAHARHVLVPNAVPGIVTGLRGAMGIAWMVIVAVEMMSGSSGIGFFVWDTYNAGNLANVIAAIVIIGVVGLLLDIVFMRLARRVTLEVRR